MVKFFVKNEWIMGENLTNLKKALPVMSILE